MIHNPYVFSIFENDIYKKKYSRISLCLPWSWNVVSCFIGLDLNPVQANFRSCTRVHVNTKIIVKSQRDFVSDWSLKIGTSVSISSNQTFFLFAVYLFSSISSLTFTSQVHVISVSYSL